MDNVDVDMTARLLRNRISIKHSQFNFNYKHNYICIMHQHIAAIDGNDINFRIVIKNHYNPHMARRRDHGCDPTVYT